MVSHIQNTTRCRRQTSAVARAAAVLARLAATGQNLFITELQLETALNAAAWDRSLAWAFETVCGLVIDSLGGIQP